MTKAQRNTLFALIIVLVLAAGIFALTKVLGTKEDPSEIHEGADGPPVVGRKADYNFTDEELTYDTIITDGENPEYVAYQLGTPKAEEIIQAEMKRIQNFEPDSTEAEAFAKVRQTHDIGGKLYTIAGFGDKANEIIREAFGSMSGVDPDNFHTYPIYGKYEAAGKAVRADLDRFLERSKDEKQRYNFTKWRHWEDEWWWFGSGWLNIMLFNDESHLASNDEIYWGKVDREGMDNFKVINGHGVPDKRLLKFDSKSKEGAFNAWGAVKFCQVWRDEMDRLDYITREYAIKNLVYLGRLIEQDVASATTEGRIDTGTRKRNKMNMSAA
jgi:hypothetical protein